MEWPLSATGLSSEVRLVALVALVSWIAGLANAASPPPPFEVSAAPVSIPAGGAGALHVSLTIPEGYHIYREMLAVSVVSAGRLSPGSAVVPKGAIVPDPAEPSRMREQFEYGVDVTVPITVPSDFSGATPVEMKVRYQACRDALCLLPVDVYATSIVTVASKSGQLLLPLVGTALAQSAVDEIPVLFTPGPAVQDHATVHVDLQGDWHLNKLFMGVTLPEPGTLTLGEPMLPPAHPSGKVEDGTFREDFTTDFDLRAPVAGPVGAQTVKVEVSYQACKGISLCKMPTSEIVEVPITFTGAALTAITPVPPAPPVTAPHTAPPPDPAPPQASPSGFAAAADQGILALVALCFAAGIGVSFTPCVLPMVPITMGMIGARSAGSQFTALTLTAAYVLGLALVYTGLGVFAGVTGALFGSWLQSPAVVFAIAAFFVAMGAAMFGFFDVGVPSFIASRLQGGSRRGGHVGAFVVGMIGAVVAGPCSGPVVVAILALIGQDGEVAQGAGLMFAFSLGMGMIFVVTGLASGWLPSRGPWMVTVKKAFGIVMWLGAIYYAAPHLPLAAVALSTAAVLLVTAIFSWPDPSEEEGWFLERSRQAYTVVGGLVGAYLLVGTLATEGFILPPLKLGSASASATPGIPWLSTEEAGLAQARAEGKPLMIDFTAEWCAACHELEKFTYTDPAVIEAAKGFVPVMVDCTEKSDPTVLAVQKKYGVLGLPTVVFVTADGRVLTDPVLGYIPPEPFLARLKAAKDSG